MFKHVINRLIPNIWVVKLFLDIIKKIIKTRFAENNPLKAQLKINSENIFTHFVSKMKKTVKEVGKFQKKKHMIMKLHTFQTKRESRRFFISYWSYARPIYH